MVDFGVIELIFFAAVAYILVCVYILVCAYKGRISYEELSLARTYIC